MEYFETEESRNPNDAKYLRAKRHIEKMKKFYSSLTSYLIFIAFLAVVNYYTNGWDYMWFLWVAFGWGIGLTIKAVKVFGLNPFFGKDWEERKIREFIEEDKQQNRWN